MLKAAMHKVCITPQGDYCLTGYGKPFDGQVCKGEGVHDDIYATSILLSVDEEKIFLYNADFIEFEYGFCEEVKLKLQQQFGIDKNLVFFSATHNHQSVMSQQRVWHNIEFSQEYYDFIVSTVLKSYQACVNSLQEVKAYFGHDVILGYYGSRIHHGEEADNEVILLQFRNSDDEVVAAICNWATHSTVVGMENHLVTADLAGNVREKLIGLKGYNCAMVVGAAGDASTRAFRQGIDFAELERVSSALAEKIAAIQVDQPLTLSFTDDYFIKHRVYYDNTGKHEAARAKLAPLQKQYEACTDDGQRKILRDQIGSIKRGLEIGVVDVHLFASVVRLCDLEIISIPGELGSRYGKDFKQLSKAKCTLIFGYTNGHFHYLLPPEEYGLSFETLGSVYRSTDVEAYVNKIKQVLKDE